ncbi:RNase adapter RapZ [Natronohydrobacter thiooxidans]|uniref:RNase adapter RapZ n=1 Tax=Natronohydrobacter thiooxidans TaxID=87172 RepID=UPI0008FF35CC|nr:RNase adapter RapZ [Natronohydrobacter thiooxidans]
MSLQSSALSKSDRLVLLTGPSGAGRSTALRALEDLGYEAIDNMPISLVSRLVAAPLDRPLALVLDPRNRDFAVNALLALVEEFSASPRFDFDLVYLDCPVTTLIQRYSETRRRHPLSPDRTAREGIELEARLMQPVRMRADVLVETESMTPHDLRAHMQRLFGQPGAQNMQVHVESFSYKRGIPAGVDLVFDCRFLNNPHWQPGLRLRDGRDPAVVDFILSDTRFSGFFRRIHDLVEYLLPEYTQEGKTQLSIGFGCTGGQHRSVAIAEKLSNALAQAGWQVSKRHRELERIAAHAAADKSE